MLEEKLIYHDQQNKKKAYLVSVFKGTNLKDICKEHLEELGLLAETFGVHVAAKTPCLVRKFDASTYVTSGKLEELLQTAQEVNADLIIFDDEISPGQQRNLEKIFKLPVMDRTEIILGVFAQRAQTKEAQLQIELAQIKYQAPRLRRLWTHLSRQAGTGSGAGGGAYLKGEGEKQIEIDKRILKRQIEQLQKEINEVKAIREMQRASRLKSEIPIFAIIGYTNAGKSTLLNALTDAKVFVEDKLFATLDTTTRKFTLPSNQEVLLIDTVGFIRKLPHLLVAAFKSTLEESLKADILLHVIDASHHMAEEQAETTFEVLKELKADERPIITILNKSDLVKDKSILHRLRLKYPKTIAISALEKKGFEDLLNLMMKELSQQRKRVLLRIPQENYALVTEVMRLGILFKTDYEENDVILDAEIPHALEAKLKSYIQKEEGLQP